MTKKLKLKTAKELMCTEHFHVKKNKEGRIDVFLESKPVMMCDCGATLYLSQSDAFDITLEELRFLPFNIMMLNPQIKQSDRINIHILFNHNISLMGVNAGYAELSFNVWGSRYEDNRYDAEDITEPNYLMELFNILKSDDRFEIDPQHTNYGKPNEALEEYADINSLSYTPYGPIDFYTVIHANTYGELCVIANNISHELDNRVINNIKQKENK